MADACENRWQTSKSTVLERNMHMFNNPVMSDIKFVFPYHDKQSIPAHKYVLATSSPVFFAMFYGELREKKETIEIDESDPDIFLQFLCFLYCDCVTIQDENNAIQLLYLADKYDIPSLTTNCVDFLDGAMQPLNAFDMTLHAWKLNHKRLEKICWEVIDYNMKEIFDDDSFSELSHELLLEVVKRSSLRIDELSLFKAVDRWATKRCVDETKAVNGANKRSVLGEDLLDNLRFPVMSSQEFADVVIPSDILSKDEIIDVLKKFSSVFVLGGFKFSSCPRVKRDVANDSCVLGTEYCSFWKCPSVPYPIRGSIKSEVLTFTVRRRIWLYGVSMITTFLLPFAKRKPEVCLAGVSVAHRGKILRTAKNHKFSEKRWLRDRAKIDVFFNRPVVLSEDTCYTIETSTNSIQDLSIFVWSSSLQRSLSDKPDSSIDNPNILNKNTVVSGVCSGHYTDGIPAHVHYKGEVLALLFEPWTLPNR